MGAECFLRLMIYPHPYLPLQGGGNIILIPLAGHLYPISLQGGEGILFSFPLEGGRLGLGWNVYLYSVITLAGTIQNRPGHIRCLAVFPDIVHPEQFHACRNT